MTQGNLIRPHIVKPDVGAREQYSEEDREQILYLREWNRTHKIVPLWLSALRFFVALGAISVFVGALVWWLA